ncbi:DUF5829 family protein [Luteipulveratus mongoliensis]|uniref:Uncharacterized protein n=1 Tax=Luteipulveratus mongoliensis TaxID=571913 RepID=A0A0K1JI73_9MICO|nr:DUF5829 family protein [Luteipulveratus mongoliensis]AKU16422.1 hypothetical protein VV02_12025 [Luteipulveratus mongoliensis]
MTRLFAPRRTAGLVTMLLAVVSTVALAPGSAAESPPARPQVAYLNHTYSVFDQATADAIEHSTYLPKFGVFQVRTTSSGETSWTGRYLMGRETYLEMFGPNDLAPPDNVIGMTGLAVATERRGKINTVQERLTASGNAPTRAVQTKVFGDDVVPWFDYVFTTADYDGYFTWAMEYLPSYLDDPRAKAEPGTDPDDVRGARVLSDDYKKRLMRDVTGVEIGVTARDLTPARTMLQAAGYVVVDSPQGFVARGRGTTLRYVTTDRAHAGWRRIDFALNRPVAYRHVETIGHSQLVVGPGTKATWTFDH